MSWCRSVARHICALRSTRSARAGSLCGYMSADAVVIRGPTGIGKTSSAWFLHKLLRESHVPHAALDIDWLTASWPEQGEWNLVTRHRHVALLADSIARAWRALLRPPATSGQANRGGASTRFPEQPSLQCAVAGARSTCGGSIASVSLPKWRLVPRASSRGPGAVSRRRLDDFVVDASQPVEAVARTWRTT
jgi:hypothetical protein